MNYLKQVLALNQLQLRDPLSKGQYMLFQALLNVNNDCGWIEWFEVASIRLELFSQMSREGVQKARKELIERGLIEFKSNGTRAGSYRLKKLYEDSTQVSTKDSTQNSTQDNTEIEPLSTNLPTQLEKNTQTSTQDSTQSSTQGSTQSSTQGSTQDSTPLNKQNKTKLNKSKLNSCSSYTEMSDKNSSDNDDNKTTENVFEFYQKNFGILSSFIQEDILYWIRDIGDGLVLEALKRALEQNKEYGYAKKIMQSWARKGIDSLEKAEAERVQFIRANEKRGNSYQRTGRVATVPDWANKPNETKETKLSPEEEQKLRDQLNALRSVAE
ncbi:DnaD domain protein [uncultured Granulicatella sp.]|uniref:DnaD domain-containing protein n=1 Tax=uncultured Granulicatella sp. TaxID=316089 RepID=UPI0028E9507D|nr:DnaD domain protein [uncultured Granulicatella sp.]